MTNTHAVEGQRGLSRLPAIVERRSQAENARQLAPSPEGEASGDRPHFGADSADGQARDTTRDTTDRLAAVLADPTRWQDYILRWTTPGPGGCWLWTRSQRVGYGQAVVASTGQYAHRVAWVAWNGAIPRGMVLDHLCRVRLCCNPAHLEPVTNRVNLVRGVGFAGVNASKTHCTSGHPLSGDNLYIERYAYGVKRHCRVCRRATSLRRARKVAA